MMNLKILEISEVGRRITQKLHIGIGISKLSLEVILLGQDCGM